jgi:hypothetical protein
MAALEATIQGQQTLTLAILDGRIKPAHGE